MLLISQLLVQLLYFFCCQQVGLIDVQVGVIPQYTVHLTRFSHLFHLKLKAKLYTFCICSICFTCVTCWHFRQTTAALYSMLDKIESTAAVIFNHATHILNLCKLPWWLRNYSDSSDGLKWRNYSHFYWVTNRWIIREIIDWSSLKTF